MITREQILNLAEEHLEDSSLFLVELDVTPDNQIQVYIDGDESVSIEECVALSRHIEFSLDRDSEDFALSVSSAGMDMPLKQLRQYKKYITKNLHIKLVSGEKMLARLESVEEESITIVPLVKNPNAKKGSKKPYTEGDPQQLNLNQIAESKIEITF